MNLPSVVKANEARKSADAATQTAVKDLLEKREEIDRQLREFGHEVTPRRGRKPAQKV